MGCVGKVDGHHIPGCAPLFRKKRGKTTGVAIDITKAERGSKKPARNFIGKINKGSFQKLKICDGWYENLRLNPAVI
jgi:hypothetical protein